MSRVFNAQLVNDVIFALRYTLAMPNVTHIHKTRQPNRPHFIEEWAEARGYKTQSELASALEADKSVVSRWYNGATPSLDWQEKLAACFEIDRESLFRHPDDDWMARFFRDRSKDEMERMKLMLEAAFPIRKNGSLR